MHLCTFRHLLIENEASILNHTSQSENGKQCHNIKTIPQIYVTGIQLSALVNGVSLLATIMF